MREKRLQQHLQMGSQSSIVSRCLPHTRSGSLAKRTYRIDGQTFDVEIVAGAGSTRVVMVNGERYDVERLPAKGIDAAAGTVVNHAPRVPAPRPTRPAANELRAPMAGRVANVHVLEGETVSTGAAMIVLDAMKMENVIQAPRTGRVQEIAVRVGDTVLQGALLARFA